MNSIDHDAILTGLSGLSDLIDDKNWDYIWRTGLEIVRDGVSADTLSICMSSLAPGVPSRFLRLGTLSPLHQAYLDAWEARIERPPHLDLPRDDPRRVEAGPVLEDGAQFLHMYISVESVGQGALSLSFPSGRMLSQDEWPLVRQIVHFFVGAAMRAETMNVSRHSHARANLLYQVSQAITGSLDLPTVLNQTTQLATEVLGAEAATLFRVDEERQQLVFMVTKGEAAELLEEQHLPMDHGVAGWVATRGEPLIVNNTADSDLFSAVTDAQTGFVTRNIVCVPLRVQDRIVGVLELLNKVGGGDFNTEDVEWLSVMGSQIAVALENARLFAREQQKVEELATLNQISQSIVRNLNVSEVLTNITASLLKISGADRSELFLVDKHQQTYTLHASAGYGADRDIDIPAQPFKVGVAGWAITQGTATAIRRAVADNRYTRRPDLPKLDESSIAVAPLAQQGRTVGAIVVYSLTGASFDEARQEILQTFANQAAIALRNAELYQGLRAEQERIIRAQEEVRHHLARELHDNTAQMLSLIIMNLDLTRKLLDKRDTNAILSELTGLDQLARQANREVRTLLFELRPIILGSQGLIPALNAYHRQLQVSMKCEMHIHASPLDFDITHEAAGAIFGIIQEAVNNIRNHARASNVWINVRNDVDALYFEVEDDGVGFDYANTMKRYDERGSYGLLNMGERAGLFSGWLEIVSPRPGTDDGTQVRGIMPRSEIEAVIIAPERASALNGNP